MTVIINMKPARPWKLAHLKIIWQFHAHPVHQKVSRFYGPRYIGDDFFLGQNLVSFNRVVVPYEISKVNFRVETQILVSMSEEI
jgi:fibronectin type 3 domain-containing protein